MTENEIAQAGKIIEAIEGAAHAPTKLTCHLHTRLRLRQLADREGRNTDAMLRECMDAYERQQRALTRRQEGAFQ